MSGSQGAFGEGGIPLSWPTLPGRIGPSSSAGFDEDAYMSMLLADGLPQQPVEDGSGDDPFTCPAADQSSRAVAQAGFVARHQETMKREAGQSMSMAAALGPVLVDSAVIDPALSAWPTKATTVGGPPSPPSEQDQHIEPAQEPIGAARADANKDDWTYAVRVLPALDKPSCDTRVAQHTAALDDTLRYKNVEFSLRLERGPGGSLYRLYTLAPRLRDNNRSRLDFLFAFSPNRPFNRALSDYQHTMSVVGFYEPKMLQQSDRRTSSAMGMNSNHGDLANGRFSPLHNMHDLEVFNNDEPALLDHASPSPSLPFLGPPTPEDASPTPPGVAKSRAGSSGSPVPSRMKPIPKPDREIMKTRDGKYRCTAAGCTDEVREFSRKCEWSKHMDKHDRPYKCPAEGCEKLPGFTYSGGLLRHEREVHGKHGGPKNPLNCPHVNCKRHDGKGFSRLENLNEHLRRVHTGSPFIPMTTEADAAVPEDREDSVSVASSDKPSRKRRAPADDDIEAENKRLKIEVQTYQTRMQQLEEAKQGLEREIAVRNQVSMAMMTELRQLRERQAQAQPPQLPSFEPGRMSGSNMMTSEGDDALLAVQHL